MHIRSLFGREGPLLSIELFPPKTPQGVENLKVKLAEIRGFGPDFISVTYGAGGGTRQNTLEICRHIKQKLGLEVMAHLTCVAHSRGEIHALLADLKAAGIDNIMALRGDPPAGEATFHQPPDGFRYAAELVGAIREEGGFGIAVAGYPEGHVEAPDYQTSLAHQISKIRAGGELIISQFFLDNAKFLRWRDDLRRGGVEIPIVAGVLPALSAAQIDKFATMNGVAVPAELAGGLARLEEDKEGAAALGIEFALAQIEGLLAEGVEGIHLYALNRIAPIRLVEPLVRGRRGL